MGGCLGVVDLVVDDSASALRGCVGACPVLRCVGRGRNRCEQTGSTNCGSPGSFFVVKRDNNFLLSVHVKSGFMGAGLLARVTGVCRVGNNGCALCGRSDVPRERLHGERRCQEDRKFSTPYFVHRNGIGGLRVDKSVCGCLGCAIVRRLSRGAVVRASGNSITGGGRSFPGFVSTRF